MPRFCTAIDHGHRCPVRTRPGQRFCAGHAPVPYIPNPCAYRTQSGRPCRSVALRGQDFCFTHSRHNHRARRPATPIIPRTRRQKALANYLESIGLPHTKTGLPEPQWMP